LDQHLFWAILFGWFLVKGAGPISLDALIGRGIAATALPLAGPITRFFQALSQWSDPAIKLLLRCWIAALFFRSGVMKISNFDMTEMLFHAQSAQGSLPPELAARLTILLELGCLIFLVLGAGTRITAIILMGLSALIDPTYQQSIDLAYYLMVLGLIALQGPGALSIDNPVVRAFERRFPSLKSMRAVSYEGMSRVVIVGGGFGGIAVARALRNTSCRVTLIDGRNYFLFQPLSGSHCGPFPGRHRRTHPRTVSRSAQRSRPARRGDRRRCGTARGDFAGCPGCVRLSGARHRRSPQLFRA